MTLKDKFLLNYALTYNWLILVYYQFRYWHKMIPYNMKFGKATFVLPYATINGNKLKDIIVTVYPTLKEIILFTQEFDEYKPKK